MGGLVGGGAGAVAAWFAAGHGVGPLGEVEFGHGSYLAVGLAPYLAAGLGAGLVLGTVGGFRGGLAGGAVAGFVLGFVGDPLGGLVGDPLSGLLNGIGFGVVGGVGVELIGRRTPARAPRWSPAGVAVGLPSGLGVGIAAGLHGGLVAGLAFGFASGVAAALVGGFVGTPADLAEAAGPRVLLARDRGTFWVVGLVGGLCLWLATVPVRPPAGGVMNLLGGVLWVAFFQAAWGSFAIARSWLAFRRHLPWRLMSFLADAHQERGVLRQTGAVYQFRHLELQHRLANR
jgi:hypothetical protein